MQLIVKYFTLLLITSLLSFKGFQSAQGKLAIENAEVSFDFVSKDVQGTISGFKSEANYDPAKLEQSVFNGSVAVETISTGNFLRDWSLKKSKYFNADEYPEISFRSTSIRATDNGFKVTGNLSIKGISKEIDIVFEESGNKLYGKFSIYSSDFGVEIKSKRQDNLVNVRLEFSLSQ